MRALATFAFAFVRANALVRASDIECNPEGEFTRGRTRVRSRTVMEARRGLIHFEARDEKE